MTRCLKRIWMSPVKVKLIVSFERGHCRASDRLDALSLVLPCISGRGSFAILLSRTVFRIYARWRYVEICFHWVCFQPRANPIVDAPPTAVVAHFCKASRLRRQ